MAGAVGGSSTFWASKPHPTPGLRDSRLAGRHEFGKLKLFVLPLDVGDVGHEVI